MSNAPPINLPLLLVISEKYLFVVKLIFISNLLAVIKRMITKYNTGHHVAHMRKVGDTTDVQHTGGTGHHVAHMRKVDDTTDVQHTGGTGHHGSTHGKPRCSND